MMNGLGTNPIYALGKQAFPGDTKWNFSDKYIFGKDGSAVARTKGVSDTLAAFEPLLGPESKL
jgi:glutathione peroxidase-family protein